MATTTTTRTNPGEFTSTGAFSLYTTLYGSQPTHTGWNFATLGFGPEVTEFSSTNVRF
jgi:hypothetical protein